MKVVSVNRGERKKVQWRFRIVETGIFKHPVDEIHLGATDVEQDHVVDRRYHGGIDKACYLYSADPYPTWKKRYPKLNWDWGMFGENVTVEGLQEREVFIGSRYRLGTALVEVSEPRQPCFKFGIRMGTQKALKEFISLGHSGVYVRVIEPGIVKPGDEMILEVKGSEFSISDVFQLLYKRHPQPEIIGDILTIDTLAESAKRDLQKAYSF
ncbi:MOSC domain-containing protein [Marinoscillum sp. MHG1-6]|uniref:MOSC domain-containing protein n=1 Tax=Marinoscillum sp. MHG1-6 TaxID=2959627 RepID=UPI0021577ED7|nr:MOSC domain-containing protein [Marinoscillum sp. MHG1-6]